MPSLEISTTLSDILVKIGPDSIFLTRLDSRFSIRSDFSSHL